MSKASMAVLAKLEPRVLASGHGNPMIGNTVAAELHSFADSFADTRAEQQRKRPRPGIKRVLIIGAGVIGGFDAARLKRGGVDVTLLARGRRLAELREHGVVLEDALSGRHSITHVPLVDRLEPTDEYDLAVVIVRRNQICSVLPMLARNQNIPSVLFLGERRQHLSHTGRQLRPRGCRSNACSSPLTRSGIARHTPGWPGATR
jgi:hypothetical protein